MPVDWAAETAESGRAKVRPEDVPGRTLRGTKGTAKFHLSMEATRPCLN